MTRFLAGIEQGVVDVTHHMKSNAYEPIKKRCWQEYDKEVIT
jgi:hypothetical protein